VSEGWVATHLGVELRRRAGREPGELVEIGLRHNPKRAHLLVSTVLGKHIPADPGLVHATGRDLGTRVAATLGEPASLVIGYAETATGLGHLVAESLAVEYLSSTRRQIPGVTPAARFSEHHSHATAHLLLPEDPSVLLRDGPVVLVDDEFSTGRTALNTIRELHRLHPRKRYCIAALVDLRSAADQAEIVRVALELNTRIEIVFLSSAEISWPADFVERAAEVAKSSDAPLIPGDLPARGLLRASSFWPAGLRDGGRHSITPADTAALAVEGIKIADRLSRHLVGDKVLVLGIEEFMYVPLLVGLGLQWHAQVLVSSTTRSPVVVMDEDGYPVRTALAFPAHDRPGREVAVRFAYNIHPGQYSDIVVVVDSPADTVELEYGLLAQLRTLTQRVHLVVVPSYVPAAAEPAAAEPAAAEPAAVAAVPLVGSDFGSYAPHEVSWLLTDLSHVALEAPTEEREEAIQSGEAHYAESLPIEYRPSEEYQQLFEVALAESAERVARAVGLVTELVLQLRGRDIVLASLARAGTPIGILMRRWAHLQHDLELPHYAVSIVRGRGIDTEALRYLAANYDPSQVVFVDGWTGKGAIARELTAALDSAGLGFVPELAVLADTGSCVSLYGTRDDFLIPSACLNSTVSGLVSRTVLNDKILQPGQFHGAKFYAELADEDRSAHFLDTVTARFGDVAADVTEQLPQLRGSDRSPTWVGWAAVDELGAKYGIGNANLIKPGVGETTRVLLRRVPWRVLIRPGAEAELGHVLLLAEQRGVPVETVEGLAYSCVGLIQPGYTAPTTTVPTVDTTKRRRTRL
jgi:adenine/guanine phosphoribosyltransferase-like PRPP-binding protein